MRPEITAYYDEGGEVRRLAVGAGRLEFLRTWDVLTRELPPPPGTVLDVGGATGVYAGPLAAAGYDVHLVDPVVSQVDIAATRPGVTATVGDALALEHGDATVDVVLLLGPLYHLTDRSERMMAWREAARVVRPGGLVVAATISRFASMVDGFVRNLYDRPGYHEIIVGEVSTGEHRNPYDTPGWFTTAYFAHPDEPGAEAAEAGLISVRTLSVEGPLWMMPGSLDHALADETLTQRMLEMLRLVEYDPSLLGAGSHLLTLARRPD